ncbi:NACHT domain-containing protein [Nonomuraea sp. NPDC003214]
MDARPRCLRQSEALTLKKGKKRPTQEATVECFLAALMSHLAGGTSVAASDVQDLFDRVPSLIVLDGLDEVGSMAARRRVVREIDLFCSRSRAYTVEPRVIVTSRPNSAGLPEPDADVFEVISLSPLDHALRDQFLRKWCAVHNVRGNDSRTLRRNFNERTREPYIGELAGNPMQLTILLYLLRQHGDATPSQRTELYAAYMNLLLAREANKHPETVRKYRTELMEIVPFLGWYVQSRAEEDGHSGRMARDEVEAAMKHFQRTYGKPENVVDELFEAATDRLWALTGKEQETYEFEVQSLREYFAARYLYWYAGEGAPGFDRTLVFRELLRRPYWFNTARFNTARFYGGHATGSDLYVLQAGITHELADNPSKHVRVASWSLITDGVFNSRPLEAAAIVDALTDDHGSKLLLEALDDRAIATLPEPSHAGRVWERLTQAIAAVPAHPNNHIRIRVLLDLLGQRRQFARWWIDRLTQAIGTEDEIAWLRLGAACEVIAGDVIDIPGLSAEDGERAQMILNTGGLPQQGSLLEEQLRRAVLDGQCTETTSVRSELARITVALSPAEFYSFGTRPKTQTPKASSQDRRSQAIQLLRKSGSALADVASFRRFQRGEKGSTFPWSNASPRCSTR